MTYGHEVDLDLVADYLGGALDGTPQAAAVERLIADDPAWTRAYAEMHAAMDAVRVDLRTLGAGRDVMPADVVRRLDAALAPVLPAQSAKVVQLAPRRRWARRFMPVAVAVSVLICVGLGATLLRPDGGRQDSGGSALSATKDNAEAPAAGQLSPGSAGPKSALDLAGPPEALKQGEGAAPPPILATGTDYNRDTLSRLTPAARSQPDAKPGTLAPSGGNAVPPQLRRLTDPAALSACLTALSKAHARAAGAVRLVDLARFEGSPAVVVLLADSVWVTGPDCGLTGPDTRFSTRTQGS